MQELNIMGKTSSVSPYLFAAFLDRKALSLWESDSYVLRLTRKRNFTKSELKLTNKH